MEFQSIEQEALEVAQPRVSVRRLRDGLTPDKCVQANIKNRSKYQQRTPQLHSQPLSTARSWNSRGVAKMYLRARKAPENHADVLKRIIVLHSGSVTHVVLPKRANFLPAYRYVHGVELRRIEYFLIGVQFSLIC